MSKKNLTAAERCDLIARTAEWVSDNTESWSEGNIGTGLAYLFWAIADRADGAPFETDTDVVGDFYKPLIDVLKANPNGLWDELVEGGFITE